MALDTILRRWQQSASHYWRRRSAPVERKRFPVAPAINLTVWLEVRIVALALVAISLLPLAWSMFGVAYAVAAIALGATFVGLTWSLRRDASPRRAALVFHYSLAYLALLFVAMAVDPLVL
jgi:heme o synthase